MRLRHVASLLVLLGCLTLSPGPGNAVVSEWGEHEPVRVRLVTPWQVAPRQGTLWLGFEVHLAEGWHIYWKNSGDAGFPPMLDLQSEPALEAVQLRFPAPERYPIPGGLVAIGYADEMVYPIEAEIDAPEARQLTATLVADYLVCEVDCIPFHDELELVVPLGDPVPDPGIAATLEAWKERLPRAAAELPDVHVEARRSRSDLVLDVRGAISPGDGTDLFFEPADGITLGDPATEIEPGRVSFRVPVAPSDVRAGLPETLELAWLVTGLGKANEHLAIEGRLELREQAPSPGSGASGPTVADLLVDGLLLGLTPSVLALLGLVLVWPQRQIREALGPLSEVWPFVAGSFAGFLFLVLGLHAWSRGSETPLFVSPTAVTLTAVPSLGLALWLWMGHPTAVHRPHSLGRDLIASLLAPLLALPWFPAANDLAPLATGRGTPIQGAVAAAGFAIPFLLVGAFVTLRPGDDSRETRPSLTRALGFLALVTLVWISYRLLDLTATDHLAFVQLVWLLAALAARMGSTTSRRAKALWWTLALLLALASVIPVWGLGREVLGS